MPCCTVTAAGLNTVRVQNHFLKKKKKKDLKPSERSYLQADCNMWAQNHIESDEKLIVSEASACLCPTKPFKCENIFCHVVFVWQRRCRRKQIWNGVKNSKRRGNNNKQMRTMVLTGENGRGSVDRERNVRLQLIMTFLKMCVCVSVCAWAWRVLPPAVDQLSGMHIRHVWPVKTACGASSKQHLTVSAAAA